MGNCAAIGIVAHVLVLRCLRETDPTRTESKGTEHCGEPWQAAYSSTQSRS